jgi:hypothetical protein
MGKKMNKTRLLMALAAATQVLSALVAVADQVLPSLSIVSTPTALTILAVATATRGAVNTIGDYLDDGKANQSFKG